MVAWRSASEVDRHETSLAAGLTSRFITAKEADGLIEGWARQSQRVCFAVCFGDLAWHVQWVGPIHAGQSGRWIQVVDHTTNVLSTDMYGEIILVEDNQLLGIRFRHPKGFTTANFEVNLFVDKLGEIDKEWASLLNKIIN
jgi:hypothetical protein